MATHSRMSQQPADELPKEVLELGRLLSDLPEPHRQPLETQFQRLLESVDRRRRVLSLVQEALSQLRLDIKYLMFDLEVTRQERDELKKQLEGL
jgi:hypothetical protein